MARKYAATLPSCGQDESGKPQGRLEHCYPEYRKPGQRNRANDFILHCFQSCIFFEQEINAKKKKNRKQFTINMAVIIQRPGSASTDVEEKKKIPLTCKGFGSRPSRTSSNF